MSILNEELDRILSVMGVVSEQDSPEQMNVNLRKTVEVLKYLKLKMVVKYIYLLFIKMLN